MKRMLKTIKKCFYIKDSKEQNEINKQLVVIVVSTIITVISVLGVTYSAFVWSDNSLKTQSLVVGNIELSIASESEALGSSLDYPVAKEDEDSLTPYQFTITNSGSLTSTYKLKIVGDDAYINTMDTQYIYMSMEGGRTINRTSLKEYSDLAIDEGLLAPGESKTYNLRLWIIENAPNSVIGKEWHGKIVLETSQTEIVADANASNLSLINDSNANSEATSIDFQVTNSEDTTKYFNINLDEITMSDELNSENFKWKLLEGETVINEGNFFGADNDLLLQRSIEIAANETKNYKLLIWFSDADTTGIDLTDKTLTSKITVEMYDQITDIALSESPVLINTLSGENIKNMKLYGNTEIVDLPSEYQQVEYIESTGTQYIDTSVYHDLNIGFDVVYLTKDRVGGSEYGTILGARSGSLSNEFTLSTYSTSSLPAGTFTYGSDRYDAGLVANEKMHITLKNNIYTNYKGVTYTLPKKSFTSSAILIFATNSGGANVYGKGQLYSLKMYNGDILIRNFVPCYRKADKVAGLYDLVYDKFYTNSGTGEFVIGDDITQNITSVGDAISDETDENYGKYLIPITVYGKNLLKYGVPSPAGDARLSNQLMKNTLIKLEPGEYTLSFDTITNATTYRLLWTIYTDSGATNNITTVTNEYFSLNINSDVGYYNTTYQYFLQNGNKTIAQNVIKITVKKTCYVGFKIGSGDTQHIGSENPSIMINPQLEQHSKRTSFESYEPVTYSIYLDAPLRSNGETRDYIDFEQGKVIRHIASDGTILSTPTEEAITLPSITTMDSKTSIYVNTTVKPLIEGNY